MERQLAFVNSLPFVGVGLLSDDFNQHAFATSSVEFAVGQTGPSAVCATGSTGAPVRASELRIHRRFSKSALVAPAMACARICR